MSSEYRILAQASGWNRTVLEQPLALNGFTGI